MGNNNVIMEAFEPALFRSCWLEEEIFYIKLCWYVKTVFRKSIPKLYSTLYNNSQFYLVEKFGRMMYQLGELYEKHSSLVEYIDVYKNPTLQLDCSSVRAHDTLMQIESHVQTLSNEISVLLENFIKDNIEVSGVLVEMIADIRTVLETSSSYVPYYDLTLKGTKNLKNKFETTLSHIEKVSAWRAANPIESRVSSSALERRAERLKEISSKNPFVQVAGEDYLDDKLKTFKTWPCG